MAGLYSLDSNTAARRALAARFTPHVRFHHPVLNPDFDYAEIDLVPSDLRPAGRDLKWHIPECERTKGESEPSPEERANRLRQNFNTRFRIIQTDLMDLKDSADELARPQSTRLERADSQGSKSSADIDKAMGGPASPPSRIPAGTMTDNVADGKVFRFPRLKRKNNFGAYDLFFMERNSDPSSKSSSSIVSSQSVEQSVSE